MKRILGLILMAAVMLTPASSFAADSYSDAVGAKLQSGLSNTLLGWTKVFSVPHAYQQETAQLQVPSTFLLSRSLQR